MKMRSPEAFKFVKEIVNRQSKGKNIERSNFFAFVRNAQNQPSLVNVNNEKKDFVISNIKFVERFMEIDFAQIVSNADVQEIEQNDDAIKILKKYKYLNSCIVCDNNNIDGELLLQRKQERRE